MLFSPINEWQENKDAKIQNLHDRLTRNRNAFANAVDNNDVSEMDRLQKNYDKLSLELDKEMQ